MEFNIQNSSFLQVLSYGSHILVAAAGKIDDDDLIFFKLRRERQQLGERVGAFECGADALRSRELFKRRERLAIGRAGEANYAGVAQVAELRSDAGVIEPRRDRVGLAHLAVAVLEKIALTAVKHTDFAAQNRRRVTAGGNPRACGLDTDHLDAVVANKGIKQPDQVAAAADARHEIIRQPA